MQWTQLLNSARRRESIRLDDDPRSEFQRDYDRALFSSAVRRLQDKAQVFPLERNDSVRTRLTHSHEVANVARSLAERVLRDPRAKKSSHPFQRRQLSQAFVLPQACYTTSAIRLSAMPGS
jgi:dGTPase